MAKFNMVLVTACIITSAKIQFNEVKLSINERQSIIWEEQELEDIKHRVGGLLDYNGEIVICGIIPIK